jgi:hypothetical protein
MVVPGSMFEEGKWRIFVSWETIPTMSTLPIGSFMECQQGLNLSSELSPRGLAIS